MTYQARFVVLMQVGDRVEQYAETNDYACALESQARIARCFPDRLVTIRDTRNAAPVAMELAA